MINVQPFEEYTQEYEEWFEKYPAVLQSEILAIQEHMQDLPAETRGIEIGVGTGRYAVPLGIKEGIEPAASMAAIARKRGIEIVDALAEDLPYKDFRFDFVLFVTIDHLDNFDLAMKEAQRVLKPGGFIIVGFLDKDKPVARSYDARREESKFYRHAVFYSVDKVTEILKKHNFKDLRYTQTLFKNLDEINEPESPKEGYGEGSYVVVSGIKK